MKKIIYLFSVVTTLVLCGACTENTLPEANFELYQLGEMNAVASDRTVTVTWIPQANKPLPESFLLSWVADSKDFSGGSREITSDQTSVVIGDLANDVGYTFSIQGRYPKGLSMKVSATCTPKSTRIPATNFKAMAGNGRVYVAWTAPETQLKFSYKLTVEAVGAPPRSIDVASDETSYLIETLTNETEYSFALTCLYEHGVSPSVSAKATPGVIDAIKISPEETPYRQFQLCTFEYNPAYFVLGEVASVMWEFGDGKSSDKTAATYCYPQTGTYTVKLTVTYQGGRTESAETTITIEASAWTSLGGVGYQKSSNVVFSPDGQMLYTIPQTSKKLIAVNAITGQIAWEYATLAATNGAGPAVGPDGTIYFGTEDADGSFYAVSATGVLKWKKTLGAAVKASPAITSDGLLYVLTDGGKLFALNAALGTERWSATQSGTASGVVVDKQGVVYMATYSGIWAYHEDGTLKWTSDAAYSVTERGGHLALCDGILYATLRAKAGCVAINTSNGQTLWTYASKMGDCYHPVVGADGSVYFCEKAGYLYAVTKNGTTKWTDEADKNYIYNGFALGANGNAYISQYAAPFNLLSFDAAGTKSVLLTIGLQTMSPVSLGPDSRLYYVTNGTLSAYDLGVALAAGGWPTRGGNLQGTNSLK